MGTRNWFTKSKCHWGFPNWKQKCPELTFRVVDKSDFPDFLPSTLLEKYNSGYFASSGSTTTINNEQIKVYIGFFVGLRVDKSDLDEQPYVAIYREDNEELLFDAYLQHGNYPGRTTALTTAQINLINSSGITVDIQTHRLPDIPSGSLSYLAENNLIAGLNLTAINAFESYGKSNL